METSRVTLLGPAGRPLLSYLPGTRDGLPWADNAALLAPAAHVADAVLEQFKGWLLSVSPVFGQELMKRGARLHRHAFTMSLELQPSMSQPVASQAGTTQEPPPGVRFVPCDHPAAAIQPAVTAAFPPGHPDHHPAVSELSPAPAAESTELEQLLAGDLVGPLLLCSLLAVDDAGAVVAGCLVNDFRPPWITLMFRDPVRSPPGTGAALLSTVIARAAATGQTSLGLAVTAGNPAIRIYQRAGFTTSDESFTVHVPN